MRGLPKYIQTRADLQNLFDMAKANELEKSEVAERIKKLLQTQYHKLPILSVEGAVITTMYFAECEPGATTEDGLTVKKVEHIESEDPDGGMQFSETKITLSKAPSDTSVFSLYMPDNFLTRNGFDLEEINYILGVLEDA